MAIKQRKPTNSASRFQTYLTFEEITRDRPAKPLTRGKSSTGGRDNRGHLTSWWRGGGHKRRYRTIDFRRDKHGIPARVASIEYDPNRSARIALLHYADGEKRYILWPNGLAVGAQVVSGEKAEVNVGNALALGARQPGGEKGMAVAECLAKDQGAARKQHSDDRFAGLFRLLDQRSILAG